MITHISAYTYMHSTRADCSSRLRGAGVSIIVIEQQY